jgi:glutamate 5-kinase
MQQKIVIKLGSLCVTDVDTGLNFKKVENIITEVKNLISLGHQVILVSSGAINSGKKYINRWSEQLQITRQQAASAIGQPMLMNAYSDAMKKYSLVPAQVLVTHDDFKHKERFINIRNTLYCLLNNGLVPIINENDTTSFEEITVGDNDQLAAMIALCLGADKLLILTEADGLYDRDPKDPLAKKISKVENSNQVNHVKFGAKTSVGRGGMAKKFQAMMKLFSLGVEVRVGSYLFQQPIKRLLSDKDAGTCFIPIKGARVNQHKLWMQVLSKNDSYIVIDEGAYNALLGHKSLLPIGIKKIMGLFGRGDVLQIKYKNSMVGVGLVEYGAKDLEKIKGKKTEEIAQILITAPSKVAIHADNILMLSKLSKVKLS